MPMLWSFKFIFHILRYVKHQEQLTLKKSFVSLPTLLQLVLQL